MLLPRAGQLSRRLLSRHHRLHISRRPFRSSPVSSQLPHFEVGQTLLDGDWSVVRTKDVPEFHLRAVELAHAHSAAKFLHLACDDDINSFSVNFKTTPMDSTGVSHILEHTTLCGSQKYPVRDPFFKMLSRSLSTFMNAMTGPDYTLYPFSTQNEKDYYNLMSVYLDAVFKPLLKKQDFRQEGWRLEQEDLSDPNSKLIIKGVVFNEMKGVFADPQQLFGRHLLSHVLPSHTYGFCSGGLPEKIPDLSYDHLKQFHARHYSPHNARFFTYGNLPLEKHLEKIKPYLPNQKEQGYKVPDVPPEPKWTSPRSVEISCAPDPSAPNSSTLAVTFLACDINDQFESFVLQIVSELLIDGSNAPFYKSLLESGLGSAFAPSTGYGNHTKDTLFTIGLQGMQPEKKDEVLLVIRDTFSKAFEEGFERDRIEAILHRTELALKEKSNSFGLHLIFGLTTAWNHTETEVLKQLDINERIQKFKDKLEENPRFLEEKVKEYFIDNAHQLVMFMTPKDTFAEEQQKVLDTIEDELGRSRSNEERARLLSEAKELEKAQADKQDISCLPSLKISDIADKAPSYATSQITLDGVPVQICDQPTNQLAFFRALLGTHHLPADLHEYLPLFTQVLTSLGAGKFDFRRMDTEIDLRTAGLLCGHQINESAADLNTVQEAILISSHCLERNVDKMFELWTEIFNRLHYDNADRLKVLVNMLATDTMNGLVYRGHSYSMGSSASTLQPATALAESFGGINNLRRLSRLAQQEDLTSVVSKLQEIAKCLLNKNHMKIALNTTPQHSDIFKSSTETFLTTLPGKFNSLDMTDLSTFSPSSRKLYYSTPFPVHFCSTSLPTVPYLHQDFAPLRIMARLLSAKFLHREIREKGGAYGGGLTASSSGVLSFYSYRDPNSTATLDAFDSSLSWLTDKNNFNGQDVDEAKLSVFQKLDEPVVPGSRGIRYFLTGITDQMFDDHRKTLKSVTTEDIVRVGEKYLDDGVAKVKGVTVIGPEPKGLDSTWTVEQLV